MTERMGLEDHTPPRHARTTSQVIRLLDGIVTN